MPWRKITRPQQNLELTAQTSGNMLDPTSIQKVVKHEINEIMYRPTNHPSWSHLRILINFHTVCMDVERTTYARYCSASWILSSALIRSAWRWLEIALAFSCILFCSGRLSCVSEVTLCMAARCASTMSEIPNKMHILKI